LSHSSPRRSIGIFNKRIENTFSLPVHGERKKDRIKKHFFFYLNNATLVFGEASLAVISAPDNSEMLPE
jgi:hypothetical protein